MKITIPVPHEIDLAHIRIEAAVNYGEEEIPNDFPGRRGDLWAAAVDIDAGKIEGWPAGRAEKMHLTVKDCGTYFLFDRVGNLVGKREQNYVPHGIVPGKYGDTIELEIAADGTVTNWPRRPDVSAFFESNN